jgi:hypothetical protein
VACRGGVGSVQCIVQVVTLIAHHPFFLVGAVLVALIGDQDPDDG